MMNRRKRRMRIRQEPSLGEDIVVCAGGSGYSVDATFLKEPSSHALVVPFVAFTSNAFVPSCLILFLVTRSERAAPPPAGLM